MKEIGLGIIGFFGHSGFALEGWNELQKLCGIKVQLRAVASSENERIPHEHLKTFSNNYTHYENLEDIIQADDIDVLVIDDRFDQHAHMCCAALQAGKHVFAEKPVALDHDSLEKLKKVYTEEHDKNPTLHLWPMMNLRYEDAFYSALAAIHAGCIGDIQHVSVQKSYKRGKRPAWYADRQQYGGTIPWVGSHAFDLITHLLGAPQHVQAQQTYGAEGFEILANVISQHNNNTQSFAHIDYLRPVNATGHGDDRMRVIGNIGILEVRHDSCFLLQNDHEEELPLISAPLSLFADGIAKIYAENYDSITTTALKKISLNANDAFLCTEHCLQARNDADHNSH